jgi:uncharacterized protein YeaC (DUF1315 family)
MAKVGRKKKEFKDLPADWRETIEELGDNGKTLDHVFMTLGFSEFVHRRWIVEEPEYIEAIEDFKLRTKCKWIDYGQNMTEGQKGNPLAWKFSMQNRHNWQEKQEVKQDTKVVVEQSATELFQQLIAGGEPSSD